MWVAYKAPGMLHMWVAYKAPLAIVPQMSTLYMGEMYVGQSYKYVNILRSSHEAKHHTFCMPRSMLFIISLEEKNTEKGEGQEPRVHVPSPRSATVLNWAPYDTEHKHSCAYMYMH